MVFVATEATADTRPTAIRVPIDWFLSGMAIKNELRDDLLWKTQEILCFQKTHLMLSRTLFGSLTRNLLLIRPFGAIQSVAIFTRIDCAHLSKRTTFRKCFLGKFFPGSFVDHVLLGTRTLEFLRHGLFISRKVFLQFSILMDSIGALDELENFGCILFILRDTCSQLLTKFVGSLASQDPNLKAYPKNT